MSGLRRSGRCQTWVVSRGVKKAPRPKLGTGLFVLPAALCSIEFEKAETTKEACEMTEQLKEIAILKKDIFKPQEKRHVSFTNIEEI